MYPNRRATSGVIIAVLTRLDTSSDVVSFSVGIVAFVRKEITKAIPIACTTSKVGSCSNTGTSNQFHRFMRTNPPITADKSNPRATSAAIVTQPIPTAAESKSLSFDICKPPCFYF